MHMALLAPVARDQNSHDGADTEAKASVDAKEGPPGSRTQGRGPPPRGQSETAARAAVEAATRGWP